MMSKQTVQSFHLESKHGKMHADAIGYEFNGKDQYVSLPSNWGGAGWEEVTVEAWVNPAESTGDFQAILSPKDTSFIHFQLKEKGNGSVSVYTDQGTIVLPLIPLQPLNQWRHVAVVVKPGETKLLIDGVQYGETNTKDFNYVTHTDELYIGRGYNNGRYFNGKIGDVRIWHDAREHRHIHGEIFNFLHEKPEMEAPKAATKIFGFKSHHNKYMSAQPDGRMEANRDHLAGWEKFTVEDAGNGKVGLKSAHGKYLSAQPDGRLEVNRGELRGWEQFTLEEKGGKVGLKSYHNKYISAQPDGSLICDRSAMRGWELFSKEAAE